MRAMGMPKQRALVVDCTLGDGFCWLRPSRRGGIRSAYSPTIHRAAIRAGSRFQQRYEARYAEKPKNNAALAYDAMKQAAVEVCRPGLNRARIQDALDQVYRYANPYRDPWSSIPTTRTSVPCTWYGSQRNHRPSCRHDAAKRRRRNRDWQAPRLRRRMRAWERILLSPTWARMWPTYLCPP